MINKFLLWLILINAAIYSQDIINRAVGFYNDEEAIVQALAKLPCLSDSGRHEQYSAVITCKKSEYKLDYDELDAKPGIYSRISIIPGKIKIDSNSASAAIQFILQNDSISSRYFKTVITLKKKDKCWHITDIGTLGKAESLLIKPEKAKSYYELLPKNYDELFIPKSFVNNLLFNNLYLVDIDLAYSVTNDRILCGKKGADMALYIRPSDHKKTLFLMDPLYKSIFFSQDNGLNSIIHEYDSYKQPGFMATAAVDINEYGELYTADSISQCIYKLLYDNQNDRLIAPSDYNFIQWSADYKPSDLDYYSGDNIYDKSDDFIAVAFCKNNEIKIYNGYAQLISTLKYYHPFYSGQNYPIIKPQKVLFLKNLFPSNRHSIAFIQNDNMLIAGQFYEGEDSLSGAELTEYPAPGDFADIAKDENGNIIVISNKIPAIHKFDFNGLYIGTYSPPGNFKSPYYLSNCSQSFPDFSRVYPNFAVSDFWGPGTGFRLFEPGGEVAEVKNTELSAEYRFSFYALDPMFYKMELYLGNMLVTGNTSYAYAGSTPVFTVPKTQLPYYGNYKWVLSYRRDDEHSWKTKEISFNHAFKINGFSTGNFSLSGGQQKYVECYPNLGGGSLSYLWTLHDPTSRLKLSPLSSTGMYTTVQYPSINKQMSQFAKSVKNDIAGLDCRVTCGSSSVTGTIHINVVPPPVGCPFVYTRNDSGWVEDNNILPQSQDSLRLGQDVDDYYPLFNNPAMTDIGTYRLAIGEFENELSFLDQAQLMIIDHDPGTYITVDDSGRIFQFAKPAVLANATMDSNDVRQLLQSMDNEEAAANDGSSLELNFTGSSVPTERWLLLVGRVRNMSPKERMAGKLKSGQGKSFTSFRLRKNQSYAWMAIPDTGTSNLLVDIMWEKDAWVDYTELSRQMAMPFSLYVPTLISAEHSRKGDMLSQLQYKDQDYVELAPDEWIELQYEAPMPVLGKERTFVFASRGRYSTLSDKQLAELKLKQNKLSVDKAKELPTEYALYQNNPNPFNPTTKISFDLPKGSEVNLTIYDLMGSEVTRIAEGYQEAGRYQVEWNAANYASGVYFCVLKAGSYNSIKKMLLLK